MDIQEIKKQLPIGALSEISKKSSINFATVQRFFKGEKTKLDIEVMEATTKYLKEYKEAKANAIEELQAVASA